MTIGDEVKFLDRRNREITGVIVDLKSRVHRKANRLAAQLGVNYHHTSDYAVVAPDGMNVVYNVPLTMLKPTGKNRQNDLSRARSEVNAIMQQRSDVQHQRASVGRETADQQGLYDLKRGDKVKVKFRNGQVECTFIKLSASGRALIQTPYGREMWTPAKFVTKV